MTNRSSTKKRQEAELASIREKLENLGLAHAAQHLSDEVSQSVKENRSLPAFLDHLLTRELNEREERRVKTSLRLSGLPAGMTLENFDFGFQPSIERRRIETLATCDFVRRHATLLVQGPPGVGKTHLCVALGVKAVEHGFSAAFYRLEDLLFEMRKDADVAPRRLRRKKYFNVAYLIVDEVGFEPMDRNDASLFFRLISYRYRRGTTAITTNKSVKDWPGIFGGDEALVSAILDRLLHDAVVLNIRGRSYRLQHMEDLVNQKNYTESGK